MCLFFPKKRRNDIQHSWRTSIQSTLPRKNSSVDTIHLCFCATDTLKLWNFPGWIILGLTTWGTPRERKRKKECSPIHVTVWSSSCKYMLTQWKLKELMTEKNPQNNRQRCHHKSYACSAGLLLRQQFELRIKVCWKP